MQLAASQEAFRGTVLGKALSEHVGGWGGKRRKVFSNLFKSPFQLWSVYTTLGLGVRVETQPELNPGQGQSWNMAVAAAKPHPLTSDPVPLLCCRRR